jgi:hypothetical protein
MKPRLCLYLFLLLAARSAAQLSWTTETVTTGVSLHGNSALVQGTGGVAGIAYFKSDGELNYASRSSGGTWSNAAAIETNQNSNLMGLSVKLTSGGDPRIAFFAPAGGARNGDARYASRTSGVWSVEDIATTGVSGEYLHLALAGDNTARVAYTRGSAAMVFGSNASGSWTTENIITTNGVPAFLRLNASGQPFVAFNDSGNTGNLQIATNPTGALWGFEDAILGFAGNSPSVSMRLNGDNPVFSFVDGGSLMLATKFGGGWTVETVVASGVANKSSLALDANGNPFIAYQTTGNVVEIASYNGVGWVSDTIGNGTLGISQGEQFDFAGGRLGLSFLTSGGDLAYSYASVSAIPEPSTYAILAGAGALGLAAWRKRRGASRQLTASS